MHVIISDEALEDLDAIWDFVAKSSIPAADRLLSELIDRCYRLEERPSRFSIVPGFERDAVRRCNVRSWAIFFAVRETHVEVLHILQGRRDLTAALSD